MALAIRYDELIRLGAVKDYAELARLGGVATRARMSQVMALLDLAPDLQEQILFLPRTVAGRPGTRSRSGSCDRWCGWTERDSGSAAEAGGRKFHSQLTSKRLSWISDSVSSLRYPYLRIV